MPGMKREQKSQALRRLLSRQEKAIPISQKPTKKQPENLELANMNDDLAVPEIVLFSHR